MNHLMLALIYDMMIIDLFEHEDIYEDYKSMINKISWYCFLYIFVPNKPLES